MDRVDKASILYGRGGLRGQGCHQITLFGIKHGNPSLMVQRINQLEHPDNFIVMVPHGNHKHGAGAVAVPIIESRIKAIFLIS